MTDASLTDLLARRTLELCAIPSVIGHEQALCDHLEGWARGLWPSESVRRIGHSLVLGALPGDRLHDPGRPTVALFGHLDTVPAHPGDAAPHLTDTHVVGLGASDMKGGLACQMYVSETWESARSPFQLVQVLYEREEGPYLENGLGPVFGQLPQLSRVDFAICLEPSDNVIQAGCCGALHARVRIPGRAAHSARPWQGENAIHKAGPLLSRLLERPPDVVEVGGLVFRDVMSVTLASGGRARNVVPDQFELNINYRFAPHRTTEQAQARLLELVLESVPDAQVTWTDVSPPGVVFSHHPLHKRLVERTGARVEAKQAWTDVARLAVHGIPSVNFGPGESAQAHQAGERIPIGHLVEGVRLLQRFLYDPR